MLSLEKVDDFLTKKLGLSDWKLCLEESKLKFLQRFVLAFGHNLYFQNLSFSAVPLADRKCPTPLDSYEMVLEKSGACCIQNNFVIKEILNILGYDAINVGCSMPSFAEVPNCHVLTVVRFKQPIMGEKDHLYNIDVGYARPNPTIEPLHLLPFRGKLGGFEFELRFNEETGNYERILFEGCCSYGKFKEGGQRLDYYFNLTPMDFHDFDWSMTRLFVDPGSKFMGNIFLYRLTRVVEGINGDDDHDFDYTIIRRKAVFQGSRNSFNETTVDTYKELAPFIQKYFPNIPKADVDAALLFYEQFEEETKAKEALTIEDEEVEFY